MKKEINTKIYLADTNCLKNKALFDKLYNSVSIKRREKIEKMRFESDKRLSLGAGLLLKKALFDIGLDYNNLDFIYGENEKPYIKNCNVYFNLSHSGDFAVCAISNSEVGVDIEQVRRANLEISKRIYNEIECKKIFDCQTEQEKNEMFIRLWTLKESYMKLSGKGLSSSPLDISITFENNRPHIENYCFFEYAFEGYRISCCSEYDDFDKNIQLVSFDRDLFYNSI